nr:hypothetical protein [Tanacetum cinerariifolium]
MAGKGALPAIYNLDVPVDSKALKPSSQTEEVPQGKKTGAKSRLREKRSLKHTSESTTEASISQTGESKKETKSSSAKDKSPSHPSPPTPVVGEMHKEPQQAVGVSTIQGPGRGLSWSKMPDRGPNQNGTTEPGWTETESNKNSGPRTESKYVWSGPGMDEGTKNYSFDYIFAGSNLSVLVDKTKSARDGLKTAHTNSSANKESRADDISLKVKLEDLSDILKDTRSVFFTPDSPPDKPIIVLGESEEEEEVARDKDTKATSHDVPKDTLVPPPPSLKSA